MFSKSASAIYKDNRALKFLYDNLFVKYGSNRVILLMLIVPLILCYVAGSFDGTLNSTSSFVGVIEDYPLYIGLIIVLSSIYIYHVYAKFLDGFLSNRLPQIINPDFISNEEIALLDDKFSRIVSPKGIFQLPYLIGILCFIIFWGINLSNSFNPVAHYGKDIWHSADHIYGFVILKSINLIYMSILLAIFFYKFLSGLIAFSWLFKKISQKNGFLIKPLSPDNCAGLRILSDLSLFFMYMILPFFLFFLAIILRGTSLLPSQQLFFLFLIILLFVTFFLPLGAVHSAMKRAKNQELESLANHFSDLNDLVKKQLKDKEYDDTFVKKIESLEKIDYLYAKVERMPVWPFNLSNLGRLLIAAAIPVIVLLIQLIVNADSIIYNLDKLKIFNSFFK